MKLLSLMLRFQPSSIRPFVRTLMVTFIPSIDTLQTVLKICNRIAFVVKSSQPTLVKGFSHGWRSSCHNDPYHNGYETALYIIKGRAETRYGPKLEHSSINKAGDFLFIPPNVPHQPINLSETEEVIAVVARNDPNEQESVVVLDLPEIP